MEINLLGSTYSGHCQHIQLSEIKALFVVKSWRGEQKPGTKGHEEGSKDQFILYFD